MLTNLFTIWILTFGVISLTSACISNSNSKAPPAPAIISGIFRVCDKKPEKHWFYDEIDSMSPESQITRLRQYTKNNCTEILQMSKFPPKTYFSRNGFVKTIVDAYNNHHNLVIRPDDVWAAIVTQFSFYINKQAEQFRGKFVNFDGKKELTVSVVGTLRNAPYNTLTELMTQKIHENLVDPQFKQWILPNFTTTTDNDLVTAGVVFMATMKKYFDYGFMLACGIPQITLEGSIQDWQNIYDRLEKLKEYKLRKWYDMLEPVVKQFVNAKMGNVDKDFWQRIVNYERGGSGPSYISGWITVFCTFDQDGNWKEPKKLWWKWGSDAEQLDWLRIETSDIPTGIVEVDVKINDNGAEYKSVMLAGHMGAEIQNEGDTVKPTLGWVIALKPDSAES